MEFLQPHYDWGDFIIIAIVLVAIYAVLKIVQILLDKFELLGNFQSTVKSFLHLIFLVYQPLAILALAGVFILVNPPMHGLLFLLALVLGFGYFKNFVTGRFIRRDRSLIKGKRLAVNKQEGVIYDLEPFGLQLQTSRGRHFVNYSKMMSDGYTVLSGEEIGGVLQLKIAAEKDGNHKERLFDILASAPYVDHIQKPELEVSKKNPNKLKARVSLKEESHVLELKELLGEWGYSCQVLKSN